MLTHKGTQSIETERLILRRFRVEDAQAVFDNWTSDDAVTKYLSWPTHKEVGVTQLVLKDWVQSYSKDDFYLWAITLKTHRDEPVGSISVIWLDEEVQKAEVGYCIGKRWWHQGIMPEALVAVMEFLFREVGINRIQAGHDMNNPNSGAVMRKCGMSYEGTLRRAARNNQGICDECMYAALAQEWQRPSGWMR